MFGITLSTPLIIGIGVGIFVILAIVIFLTGYIKATPDIAKVISGVRKEPRTIIGRSGFRWPLLERVDELYLKLISIDVKTSTSVPTADYINITVDSVVNIQVSKNPENILLAERNFLNKDPEYISKVAREVLEGNMREIVGKMTLEQMVSDRQTFAEEVKKNAVPDLANMGLDIISFNVQNFIDENEVIKNLGVDNIVKIQKKAAVAKAEAEKEIAQANAKSRTEIAQAEAKRDLEISKSRADADMEARKVEAVAALEIQKAEIERDREADFARVESEKIIIEKENEKALKQAELEAKTNSEKAKADAAYAIQEQEQRKAIETATADANLVRQAKEVELKKRQAEIQEQELNARVKKQAEAEKYAAMQQAEAELFERQKAAEAAKYEMEQKSEAELIQKQKAAEAIKYEQEQEAEALVAKSNAEKTAKENEASGQMALAKAIAAKGQAEADAIQAKLSAEAEGQKLKLLAEAEGIEKKAEAQKKMGEASITEMQLDALKEYINVLPEVARNMAEPMSKIGSVTMYGEGDVSKFMSGLTSTFKQISDGMNATGGINMSNIMSSFLGNKLAGNNTKDSMTAAALQQGLKSLRETKPNPHNPETK